MFCLQTHEGNMERPKRAVPCISADGPPLCGCEEKRKAFREILRCAETCDGLDEAISTATKARLLPVMSDSLRREMKILIRTMLAEDGRPRRAEAERPIAATAVSDAASWPSAEAMPYSPSMETLLQRFPSVPVVSKCSTRSIRSSDTASTKSTERGGACTAIINIVKSDGRSRKARVCVRNTPGQISTLCSRTANKHTVTLHGSIALSRAANYFPTAAENEKFCGEPSLQHVVYAATLSEVQQRCVSNRNLMSAGQRPVGYSRRLRHNRMKRHRIRRRVKSKNRPDTKTRLVKVKRQQQSAKQSARVMAHSSVHCSLVTLLRLVLLWAVLWLFDDGQLKQFVTVLIREPAVRHDVTAQSATLCGSIREIHSTHEVTTHKVTSEEISSHQSTPEARSPTHQATPETHSRSSTHQVTAEEHSTNSTQQTTHSRSSTHQVTAEEHSTNLTQQTTPEEHSRSPTHHQAGMRSPTYAEIARHKSAMPKPQLQEKYPLKNTLH